MEDKISTLDNVLPCTTMKETNGNVLPSSSLPPEILVNIFGFLCSVTDLLSCAQVNQAWHHVITAFYIWHTTKFKNYETFSRFHEILQMISKTRRKRALENWDKLIAAYLSSVTETSKSETSDDDVGEGDETVGSPTPLANQTYFHSTRYYGHFVIKLDLSKIHKKANITEKMFCDLFPNIPNLENVNFYNCYTVTDEVIKNLTESCHRLRKLKLFGCTSLSNKSLDYIGMHCTELTFLNMGFCTYVTSTALQRLLERCRRLSTLVISHCSNAPAITLIPMVKNLQGLQKLYMYRGFTSDLIVKSLIPQIPRLRKLDLGISKPKITDVGADIIAQYCPNLVHLSLSFSLVTCEGLKNIGQGCKKLSFLDLSGCCNIGHGLYDVLKYFTELKTIYLKSLLQISGKSFSTIIKSNIEHVSFFSSKILEAETYDVPSKEDKSYSKVKKLILDYCEISNKNLKQIAHWSKNLEHLDISLVYDADDEILQFLCDNLENLKFVLARGCYRISQVKQAELNKHQRIKFSF